MRRLLLTLAVLVPLLLAGAALAMGASESGGESGEEPGEEAPLARYQWEKRVLLVFAPNQQSPELGQQLRVFMDSMPGMLERDLIVLQVLPDRVIVDGAADGSLDSASLRETYRVQPEEFMVVLVGKDGGAKLSQSSPVAVDELFGLIDSMPMRQQEMRELKP